jgi:hypothetical protein
MNLQEFIVAISHRLGPTDPLSTCEGVERNLRRGGEPSHER